MSTDFSASGASLWSGVSAALALNEAPRQAPCELPIGQRRRRGYDATVTDGRAQVELIRDVEGVLRWVYTPPLAGLAGGRRAYRSIQVAPADVVERFRFNELGRNEVTSRLVDLDAHLTPGQGMKIWKGDALEELQEPVATKGPVLLLVHGTFSKSEMWTEELLATNEGKKLVADWQKRYAFILAFSHPTLSVGAWSNAIDLHRALRGVTGPIDIVCHSRGGLVVSWLLRLQPMNVKNVVFVGSPLVGTSLAAPDKLRAALDLLANYAEALSTLGQAASTVFPLAAGVAGLAKIVGKTLRLGSGLPILDGAIALIPGLSTQQAVGNNLDLLQLFADDWLCQPTMSAVGGSFQPDESAEPLWKFWKRFTHIGDQIKCAAADLVFSGPNDLVVDVKSMCQLGEKRKIDFNDLGISPTTHHTNYFRDKRVLDYLAGRLS
jgi:pimeloyl-ACP methyl ester carboxylesterase